MKKTLTRIAGFAVGVVLMLALIGYVFGPNESAQDAPKAVAVNLNSAEGIDSFLQEKGLSLCEVYKWIGDMEAETRAQVEKEYPSMNVVDRSNRLDDVRDLKWKEYCVKQNLPDSIRTYVNGYGLESCK
ncbi:hypothetical protein [Rudanella lutea]|uniref:hypothetical protein n=1 Tax=Rudanella lutea TaxID=451374 RepID=UPI000367F4B0|nr:hypothetical protein [Rudanella lutea]